mgnify:CR=1 FL=1
MQRHARVDDAETRRVTLPPLIPSAHGDYGHEVVDIGARPGGYELLAKLGSGGMATLYLARRAGSAGFERLAAVKVVHPHLAEDERFALMFVDEAKLSSRIHHPNVVRVEDFGEHEGTYFMTMEYVHGCSLAQLMRELSKRSKRLQPALAAHIVMQVAAGLHAAHEATDSDMRPLDLVHRDVSPQNVLLSYSGLVKLIDFGIAKARFRAQETKSIRIKGKLGYMAPEQVRMGELDRRTDVYALGIVLWEMLTMRRYFHADNELAMLNLIHAPVPKPPSDYVDLDPELERVVMSAVAPDPADRPATARELRQGLAQACPEALVLDAANLAELLRDAMSDHRAKLVEKLPPSVVGELDGSYPSSPGAFSPRPLTEEIELPSGQWSDDTFEETPRPETPPDSAASPQVLASAKITLDGPRPGMARKSAEAVVPVGTPFSGTEPRRRPPLWVVLTTVLGLAAGIAVTRALIDDGDEPTGETTTSLPAGPPIPNRAPPEPAGAPLGEPETSTAVAPHAGGLEDEPPPVAPSAVEPALELADDRTSAAACDDSDHRCVIDALLGHAETADELAMLADAQHALGDRVPARRTVRVYLERYPHGPDAPRLRRLLGVRRSGGDRRGGHGEANPGGGLPFSSTL